MKRIFDLLVSLFAILLICPFLLLIGFTVRAGLGEPALFRQRRAGFKGKPFVILKYRTMVDIRDESGNLLPDACRLTKWGTFLRRTSLDELPTLFNVIKGEMSLVGPRPLLIEYLPLYSTEQARRHDVRPGITGWAQVNGRNALSWEEKFKLDVWYVDNQSFLLDCKILLLTLIKVFKREGINQKGHVTMEKFRGNGQKYEQQV